MTLLHKNLTGDQLHESKGLAAATDKQYNLAASGANSWEVLTADSVGTASASSSVDINNLSGYSTLIVTFQDVLLASSSFPLLRVSSDNGSSFVDTSIYYTGINQDGTSSMSGDFTALYLNNATTTDYHTGKIVISNFNQAVPSAFWGHVSSTTGSNFTTAIAGRSIKGFINSNTAWNAIRVYASTGNITSGRVTVEGIKA